MEWWGGDRKVKGWCGDKRERGVTKEVEYIKQQDSCGQTLQLPAATFYFLEGETGNIRGMNHSWTTIEESQEETIRRVYDAGAVAVGKLTRGKNNRTYQVIGGNWDARGSHLGQRKDRHV